MYYVFEADIVTWRNRRVFADILTPIQYTDYSPPDWWDATPLIKSIPTLQFAVNPKAPLLDNYNIGYYQLYSQRLIDLLQAVDVRFELFAASLVDIKTQAIISDRYAIFHLLEIYSAVDKTLSDTGKKDLIDDILQKEIDDLEGQELFAEYIGVRKLVVSNDRMIHPKPLFRVAEHKNLVFIHESLKVVLDAEGITGCRYTPVGEYQVLPFG
jgi:hypothetical protein